uniref:lachrymatory-factor synthase-like n=1 Tax=Erigeron canadensis TaxID=72917 RepID=UPI001CB8B0E7|nr:lachrymatory-factor synthase-like [Erigeron canadensis]
MADEETKSLKWEGKATTELKTTKAQQVFPLLEDFCNIHKWLPALETCTHVQGVDGKPGLVRHCTFKTINQDEPAKWCYETLLSLDPVKQSISYKVTENTLGLSSYVAELKVIEINDNGCKMEWWFTADPMEEMTLEGLTGYIDSLLKAMAETIENELK